jgi:quercetin dioxygenase-like cupin family protein
MDELLSISHLADIPACLDSPRQLGFVKGTKGETAYLNIPDASRTVMVFELLADQPRGNHYHQVKEEYIYIIEGSAKLYVWLPEQPEQIRCIMLKKADWVCIKPGLAHLYLGAPRALVLEQSPVAYNKEHTFLCETPNLI